VSTNDDNTAQLVSDLATATELIRAVARDARSTALELETAASPPSGSSWTS